jgi:hypothetical protein
MKTAVEEEISFLARNLGVQVRSTPKVPASNSPLQPTHEIVAPAQNWNYLSLLEISEMEGKRRQLGRKRFGAVEDYSV